MRDGRTLSGELGQTSGVADDPFEPGPAAGGVAVTPILIIDDGLRRTYVHKTAVREVLDEAREPSIQVRVWQNVAERGVGLGSIGAALRVTPLDEFGRRVYEMPSPDGTIAVVQGVTRITPVYTQIEGLRADPRSYVWDQRVATSSLPRDALARVLRQAVPRTDLDARLQVVRLYLQAERYRDARLELERVQADFRDTPDVEGVDFAAELRQLRRLGARRLLDEIGLRRDAGQHRLARTLLERFPAEGVPGEVLRSVREQLDEIDAADTQNARLLGSLGETAGALADDVARRIARRMVAEITARLTPATVGRLNAYREYADGDALSPAELAAVAISGWLLGSNNAVAELPVALSLVRVRDDVRRYLRSTDAAERESLLIAIRDADGATVPRVADLLRRMEPPGVAGASPDRPDEAEAGAGADGPIVAETPDVFTVSVGERDVTVHVVRPPEYDPLRVYPTIVTLPAIGVAPGRQLDYWAGPVRGGAGRVGQATRRGYLTVAVDWAAPTQLRYGYTAEEHAAVLRAVRGAMRRLAIDPDRVFLTGHGDGGDAAWDVALAHPDLWAGVLPYLAVADRYCGWYWENAKEVPWRIVLGELDAGKVTRNARELDRYLKPKFDATVVEYRGRGYDPLGDDVQRAFEWMARKRRGPPPDDFECSSMRPSDSYFWWLEAEGLNARSMVPPAAWPPKRGVRAATLRGRRYTGNKFGVFGKADRLTVWLSPELIDFDAPAEIEWNGRRITPRGEPLRPDLAVLLEDARTRADRRRPYWAKVTAP